jgi:hypothetical protein
VLELIVNDGDEEVALRFEHSLLSLSKWESRTRKVFLSRTEQKSHSELLDYFQDMLLSPEGRPELVYLLSPEQMDRIANYINEDQTASSVPQEGPKQVNPETITSELIYYWLVAMRIPFHPVESWHLSRCMMLVQITNYKNQPPKKKNPRDVMRDWRQENERRKKLLGTTG